MGWSRLRIDRAHPLLEGVRDGDYAYFVHSYVCPTGRATLAPAPSTAGRSGGRRAAAMCCGCQFHPERSAATGARILANFLALPC